jgi:hypothetical protein
VCDAKNVLPSNLCQIQFPLEGKEGPWSQVTLDPQATLHTQSYWVTDQRQD